MNTQDILTNDVADVNNTVASRKSKIGVSAKVIPDEYIEWALQQSPTVMRLFIECWLCDGYGNKNNKGGYQYKNLVTTLKGENFRKTKKILETEGLFKFERLVRDKTTVWRVWNCNGVYSGQWKIKANQPDGDVTQSSIDETSPTVSGKLPTVSGTRNAESIDNKEFENPQRTSKELSKEYLTNNQEKEINNTNTLYENKNIKPDLDQARTRDENIELEHEPKEKTIAEKLAEIQKIYEAGKAHEVLGYSDIHARRFI
jgi:hypothetical protein